MIELWVNYWSGDFFVGYFEDKDSAENYYNDNKERYRDERGAKHGYPYATPIYQEVTG